MISDSADHCIICNDEFCLSIESDCTGKHGRKFFGQSCYRKYLTGKIDDRAYGNLCCMYPSCREPLSAEFIQACVSSEKYEKYTTEKETVNKAVLLTAGSKYLKIRRFCQFSYETSLSAFRRTVTDSRRCPNCRFIIEKDGGCNHMTCQVCGHEFHWCCGQKYKNNNHLEVLCILVRFLLPTLAVLIPFLLFLWYLGLPILSTISSTLPSALPVGMVIRKFLCLCLYFIGFFFHYDFLAFDQYGKFDSTVLYLGFISWLIFEASNGFLDDISFGHFIKQSQLATHAFERLSARIVLDLVNSFQTSDYTIEFAEISYNVLWLGCCNVAENVQFIFCLIAHFCFRGMVRRLFNPKRTKYRNDQSYVEKEKFWISISKGAEFGYLMYTYINEGSGSSTVLSIAFSIVYVPIICFTALAIDESSPIRPKSRILNDLLNLRYREIIKDAPSLVLFALGVRISIVNFLPRNSVISALLSTYRSYASQHSFLSFINFLACSFLSFMKLSTSSFLSFMKLSCIFDSTQCGLSDIEIFNFYAVLIKYAILNGGFLFLSRSFGSGSRSLNSGEKVSLLFINVLCTLAEIDKAPVIATGAFKIYLCFFTAEFIWSHIDKYSAWWWWSIKKEIVSILFILFLIVCGSSEDMSSTIARELMYYRSIISSVFGLLQAILSLVFGLLQVFNQVQVPLVKILSLFGIGSISWYYFSYVV